MNKVLGVFGKGIKNSRTLNYSRSATDNCDKGCQQFNAGCYAERLEGIYPSLAKKLNRHELMPPENLNYLAIAELDAVETIDWVRISAFGSVPKSRDYRRKAFRVSVDKLFAKLVKKIGRPDRIHLPVESYSKAKAYREMAEPHGICVRESLQNPNRLKDLRGPSSIVVGQRGQSPAHKYEQSQELAVKMRASGQTAVVCPAIVRDSKCGRCTACADTRVDLILYPLH